ncbi:membrane protein [Vibrio tubiashii ATCC 19109]|uniref:Membrane protein n=2 Tax=Vibrio tubiashii TaxID=29498 RepID=F9T0Q4_9VIBR|nr:DMT family transporter [Vibrio tubiashii]AIW14405.1 membrane protein [Vibrio tubiashii ATCC 19109]EGU58611.1 membrane protein [Vibrio tubiashii ATCC 19109]EIF03964.1 membrane protein [Vibrio tubiashii NCIMB 1337 = ATCC 19106]
MFGTIVSFCLMAIGARELSQQLDTFQILFFRTVIALIIVSVVIIGVKRRSLLRTERFKLHLGRNLFHFAGQYGWFLGIGLLPLAEVFALEFTVPLWTLLIAYLFLGERLTRNKLCAALLGFCGVLVIVKPGFDIISPASFIVLIAAFCYAVAHASTKSLASSEHPLTILFFMCAIQLPIGFSFSIVNWHTPQGIEWLWLLVIGFTSLSAHYCMTKAMQCAEVSFVVTMDFLRLPMIALVGVLLYSEPFEISLFLGAALMLLGNLIGISSPKPLLKSRNQTQ